MPTLSEVVSALQSWGELAARPYISQLDWSPVDEVIVAATRWSEECYSCLLDVLKKSGSQLSPLEDPLHSDLGLHRWLTARREENYSDWLAWILEQLRPDQILRVLRINSSASGCSFRSASVEVNREVPVPGGRLDIQIAFDSDLLVIIEIKKTSADDADTDKQVGYADYAETRRYPHTHLLLLATEAANEVYPGGFEPYSWRDFCIGLRRLLPELVRHRADGGVGLAKAAMVVAFIAAAEQNLVGLTTCTDVGRGVNLLAVPRTVEHIRQGLIRNTEETDVDSLRSGKESS